MDILKESRDKLDIIDKEMARLFCERMAIVSDIGQYKKDNNLPVLDRAREESMIEKNSAKVDERFREYYVMFLEGMLAASRQYQTDKYINDDNK